MRLSPLAICGLWPQLLGGAEAADSTVTKTLTVSPTMVWTTPPGKPGVQTPYTQKFTAMFSGIASPLSGRIGMGFITGSVGSDRNYPLQSAGDPSSLYAALSSDTEVFNYTGPAIQQLRTDEKGRVIPEPWATVVALAADSTWYGPSYSQNSMDISGISTTTTPIYGTYTGQTNLGQGTSVPTTAAASTLSASVSPALTTSTSTTVAPAAAVTPTSTTLAPGVLPTTTTTSLPTVSSATVSTPTIPAANTLTQTTTSIPGAVAVSTPTSTTDPAAAAAATSLTSTPGIVATTTALTPGAATTPIAVTSVTRPPVTLTYLTTLPGGGVVITLTTTSTPVPLPVLPGDGAVGGNGGVPNNNQAVGPTPIAEAANN